MDTAALFHRMRKAAEQLHGQGSMSGGRRSILREIDRLGARTVPQMARARPVSRQHIQALVNELLRDGHVGLTENPAHRRSRLVRLTSRGEAVLKEMNRREARALRCLEMSVAETDLEAAAAALRAVRRALESKRWNRLTRTMP